MKRLPGPADGQTAVLQLAADAGEPDTGDLCTSVPVVMTGYGAISAERGDPKSQWR